MYCLVHGPDRSRVDGESLQLLSQALHAKPASPPLGHLLPRSPEIAVGMSSGLQYISQDELEAHEAAMLQVVEDR